jgi:hypothetical protein
MAFADPRSLIMFLSPNLVVSWNNSAFTLYEWSQLFMLVTNSASEGPTLAATLEAIEDFSSKAEAHRTPGKRNTSIDFTPLGLRASPYQRQLAALISDEGQVYNMGSEEALEVLRNLGKGGQEKVTHFMPDLSDRQANVAKDENLAIQALEHKVSQRLRGTKPEAISYKYKMWSLYR